MVGHGSKNALKQREKTEIASTASFKEEFVIAEIYKQKEKTVIAVPQEKKIEGGKYCYYWNS